MKTIFVTGGAGFIGSHTCLVLLENGYNLIVLDSFVNSSPVALERVYKLFKEGNPIKNNTLKVIKGDLRSQELLENIFEDLKKKNNQIDAVIHFAGLKSVAESIKYPLRYWDVNVIGSINLFKIMSKYQCKTIVFSSSATIYGKNAINPINEDAEINPLNPYGNTKYVVEKMLEELFISSLKNWKISILRYFNPVGAHYSGKLGEDPLNTPNNLFPYISQVAVGRRKILKIFGNNWPTNDGTGVRDYIHVMDLAEGHHASLDYLFSNKPQIIKLNLGTGIGTSVLEFVMTFQEVNNCSIFYEFVDRRPGDIGITIANNKLAKKYLNWFPSRDLEDICRDGWCWQKGNPYGYKSN